nr:hypothetical protein [Amylibacter sp.]
MTELLLFTAIRDILNRLDQKDTATEQWDFLANTAIETGGQIIDPTQQGRWTADAALAITIYNVFAQGEDKAAVVHNWRKTAHCMLNMAGRDLPAINDTTSSQPEFGVMQ